MNNHSDTDVHLSGFESRVFGSFDFRSFPMGPSLRQYLGIKSEYRGDLVAKVNDEAAVRFAQALIEYAADHPVTDGAALVNLLEELVTMDMPGAALALHEAHPDIFPVNDFRAQFHLGNAAMLAGSLVIAEHAFTEAQKLVPAETAPYVNMAQILIHDQRFDEAQHWIEAGLAVDANHCGLWEILAWVFQQQEIPDHPKSLEKMARERNSWAGLSLVADLVAPEEPERKLMFLEGIYNEGDPSEEFLVEYTAVLGQCGLYDRIAPVIWRAKAALASKPFSWKLQLHLVQSQIATEQLEEARESVNTLLNAKGVPASVIDTVVPALLAEIEESASLSLNHSKPVTMVGAKNELN